MEDVWVEGYISVTAVLQSPYRPVTTVYFLASPGKRQWRQYQKIKALAHSHSVPVNEVDASFFEINAAGRSHGGIMAKVGQRDFVPLEALIEADKRPFIVMIDGVEDPYNFGQAVRSLYSAGTSGLVLRPRNWSSAVNVVTRSSAGTSELLPIGIAETAVEAADFFRGQGLKIACTAASKSLNLYDIDLRQPLFVLIGGEKRGITRSFINQADFLLNIPYERPFDYALGTAASAAILGYERVRQLKTAI